ncbi:MAG TPA: 1-acyl-sn-glycerol-3-phosphate acyltransferase, partial [Candidatus Binatia bacterium]|nr:1-acyl-sn-glycerol-3-phosphate acyltransferase [Candidatus Binatia bacterium]
MAFFDRTTYPAMRLFARAFAARRLIIEVAGLPHVPKHGPVLVIARHYHHLFDGIALLLSVPRPIHILVTLDWIKSPPVRQLMERATSIARWPVVLRSDALRADVDSGQSAMRFASTSAAIQRYQRKAIGDAVELLAQGRILVIFPEGYPNIDPHYTPKTRPEEFLRFKSGFAVIAGAAEKHQGARIPMLPIGLAYTRGGQATV